MNKRLFLSLVLSHFLHGNKIKLVKLMYDISADYSIKPSIQMPRKSLMECKDFADEHFTANKEDHELIWKFCTYRLK